MTEFLNWVFSLLSSETLQSVTLFINKCDLLSSEQGRQKAEGVVPTAL